MLPCHPVLLFGGFPLPSGCASRLRDVSYLLFSYSFISCKHLCSALHQCSSMSLVQSQPVPGKRSLEPASQQASGEDSTASQKTVHRLQNLLFCTNLPSLMYQVGNRDPTQPSRLISIYLLHCYREGNMAPRHFPATSLPCPEGATAPRASSRKLCWLTPSLWGKVGTAESCVKWGGQSECQWGELTTTP